MELQLPDFVAAWRAVSSHLVLTTGAEDFNVLVKFPAATAGEEVAIATYNPRQLGTNYDDARNVANTIFPSKTRTNSVDRHAFYARYLRAHRRNSKQSWGTYFDRFVSFGEKGVNQLERVVAALTTWQRSYRAALLMHSSSADTDGLRPLGGPCLQYVQFTCPDKTSIDLVAVYRNHDYCNKALGNFVGLSRLLRFVCDESGKTPGMVTCLSVHAYLETSKKNQKVLAHLP